MAQSWPYLPPCPSIIDRTVFGSKRISVFRLDEMNPIVWQVHKTSALSVGGDPRPRDSVYFLPRKYRHKECTGGGTYYNCWRVSAGIRNARANGKVFGRSKSTVDRDRILELKAQGQSLRQIASTLNVGYGTVRVRLLASHKM